MKKTIVLFQMFVLGATALADTQTLTCKSQPDAKNKISITVTGWEEAKNGAITTTGGTLTREFTIPFSGGEMKTDTIALDKKVIQLGMIPVLVTEEGAAGQAYAVFLYDLIGAAKGMLLSQVDSSLKDANLSCGFR